MHRNKYLIFLSTCLILIGGCIEPFHPKLSENEDNLLVISGSISNVEGYQHVTISRSSAISKPKFKPLAGCSVQIADDQGNVFPMEYSGAGEYRVWISGEYLSPGISYQLKVETPDGEEYASAPDTMPSCPAIDSVYYEFVELPAKENDLPVKGVQFYLDITGSNNDSRYYRWDMEETWEYQSRYSIEYIYDGSFHHILPVDDSRKKCWNTGPIETIFTLNTHNLKENKYRRYLLHFVNNQTQRLFHIYSLLISQYAITEKAFLFWEQLRQNSNEQGGLYEKQPMVVEGNIQNIHRTGERVLGFFGACSVKSKRYFFRDIPGLIDIYSCTPFKPEPGFFIYRQDDFPVYCLVINNSYWTADKPCFDCTLTGGTTMKPDFWPN